MVVIVSGLPGSGKSFFAARLAEKMGATYLSSDKIRKEMLSHRTYSRREKLAVYEEMLLRMKAAGSLNKNVVLDATFYNETLRRKFMNAIPANNSFHFIEVRADELLVRKRLEKPRTDSEADFTVYELIRKEWEPVHEPHLTLESTDGNIEGMIRDALLYIHHN